MANISRDWALANAMVSRSLKHLHAQDKDTILLFRLIELLERETNDNMKKQCQMLIDAVEVLIAKRPAEVDPEAWVSVTKEIRKRAKQFLEFRKAK